MSKCYFGWVGHYFEWVGLSGGVWGIILNGCGMCGALFWMGGGGWKNILGGWGWVGMSGDEWGGWG